MAHGKGKRITVKYPIAVPTALHGVFFFTDAGCTSYAMIDGVRR